MCMVFMEVARGGCRVLSSSCLPWFSFDGSYRAIMVSECHLFFFMFFCHVCMASGYALSRVFVCVLHPYGFPDVEHEGVTGNVSMSAVVMRNYASPLAGFRSDVCFLLSSPYQALSTGQGEVLSLSVARDKALMARVGSDGFFVSRDKWLLAGGGMIVPPDEKNGGLCPPFLLRFSRVPR